MVYLQDKYAIRYIDILDHRCEAFKFYWSTATYSDTVAFWFKDYSTPQDAVNAAKLWLLRGELEHSPEEEPIVFNLASGLYVQPKPEMVKPGW